ncbi:MAG TPA: polysaccharide export protein [Desulfobacterales bacterium]|nr:polysaccharide export protein [Desulfobacterales bacterium]
MINYALPFKRIPLCHIWALLALISLFPLMNTAQASPKAISSNAASPATKGMEYIIGRGDQLQVMVWKEKDLSQAMSVRIDGRISLPLIGDVMAAGKTISGLTHELEKRFASVVTDPAVSVMLIQSKSWRYYIIGKINKPGEFPIDFPITILQAIAKSGGFTQWAKSDNISILRQTNGHDKLLKFNYDAVTKGKDLAQNIQIKPGDTIIVP